MQATSDLAQQQDRLQSLINQLEKEKADVNAQLGVKERENIQLQSELQDLGKAAADRLREKAAMQTQVPTVWPDMSFLPLTLLPPSSSPLRSPT